MFVFQVEAEVGRLIDNLHTIQGNIDRTEYELEQSDREDGYTKEEKEYRKDLWKWIKSNKKDRGELIEKLYKAYQEEKEAK